MKLDNINLADELTMTNRYQPSHSPELIQ